MAKRRTYSGPCALEEILATFASKWKPAILYHLYEKDTLRHGELRRLLPGLSQRIMTQQLRDLERDGLVVRKDYQEVKPKVEYAATDLARSIRPLFVSIEQWGAAKMESVEASRENYDRIKAREHEQ